MHILNFFFFLANLLPKKTIEDNRVWFEYLPNTENPTQSKYQCRLCHKYYDLLGLDSRYRPALADPTLKNSYEFNRQKIAEHAKLNQHQLVISKLQEKAKESIPEQFKKIQKEKELEERGQNAVTIRMIRSVYTETMINLPFISHPAIVQLQEANGVFLGYHHYDRTSAVRMVNVISTEMHDSLIKQLTDKQSPVSLIVDSSTDNSQNHYLIAYFQALESNIPVIYFYKLILLQADETASGLLQALVNAWESETHGFSRYLKVCIESYTTNSSIFACHVSFPFFKVNLRGFASDGAAVMLGKHNGLKKLINDWTLNGVYGIHCMAHRLHLAIRAAITTVPYYTDFEAAINELHNFYNRHGHKRKAHLRELAYVMDVTMKELSYIFEVRWISSEFKALQSINSTWFLVVTDLDSISVDPSFNDLTRSQAKGLSSKLKNKNFLLALQFTCDVLFMLSHWSKRLQQRSGILVGAEKYKNQMLETFEELKNTDGSFLTFYRQTVICSDSLTRKCSPQDYERSISVRWQTVELEQGGRVPSLNIYRSLFLTALRDQIEDYFPEGSMTNFDILLPTNLPQKESQIMLYGLGDIQALAGKFGLDPASTVSQWTQALINIAKSDEFCRFQKEEAIYFWQHYLNSQTIPWGDNISKLIKLVLVLPIGSADAERGFSIMNHVRTARRSKLQGNTLDNLLRIRINGPKEIQNFNAAKYAKAWISQNHLRTDDPSQIKKKRPNEIELDEAVNTDLSYFPSSTIF